jgi:hypothetical protein
VISTYAYNAVLRDRKSMRERAIKFESPELDKLHIHTIHKAAVSKTPEKRPYFKNIHTCCQKE